MIKEKSIYLRLTNDEFKKLDELAKQTKLKKNEVLRNLIMTSGRDNLSMEILQRLYLLIQIVLKVNTKNEAFMQLSFDDKLPESITKEWLNEMIEEAKKRYPND
jgi:hypothetical protein